MKTRPEYTDLTIVTSAENVATLYRHAKDAGELLSHSTPCRNAPDDARLRVSFRLALPPPGTTSTTR
jgi:hypothetical protein